MMVIVVTFQAPYIFYFSIFIFQWLISMVIIATFQAPYIFADYTWFYIGIGATAGKENALKYHDDNANDDCNDADDKNNVNDTKKRERKNNVKDKNNVTDKTIPGAALLLILANVCLGCKYK